MVELKFCGMTRPDDVARAIDLGADYVGVIFAGGPRHQSLASARRVLAGATSVRRVGVIDTQTGDEVAELVGTLGLDAIQVHADPDSKRIRDVRAAGGVDTWAVVRIAGSELPRGFDEVATVADAIVLDARTASGLGGTGVTLPWAKLAGSLAEWRGKVRLVLAGGLRPQNVCEAIAAIEPDVVDVSSGVESAPGIKDHELMRAFRDAIRGARIGETG